MIKLLAQKGWLFLLPLLLIFSGPAAAAQFSALMMIKDGDKVMPGKIYQQDGKLRQEFSDDLGRTVTIVRPDKKVVWVILPLERAYLEMPLKKKLPGQFLQMPPEAVSKRQVCKETVNGCETEKFEVTVRGGQGLERQTVWVSTKLGTPVKMECKERRFCLEYKSIKEGVQPDRLFEVPPSYQKLSSLGGFADRIME
jgi:outer membrane lipoprotein-sorting protein